MKAAPYDYVAPATVEEACTLLAEAGGGATLLAGGQTLMPLLALRMSQPFIVVDLGRIAALQGVTVEGEAVRIGPMTGQNAAIADPVLARELPVLVEAMRHVGHHQTRNRGTIGGSIAFGEPAAEQPAAAVALGAVLEVRSVRGMRRVLARDFYLGPYSTVLEPDEMITAIVVPRWPPDAVPLFREVARRPGDFALVGMVGALAVVGGRIARAGLCWFGMGATPIAARKAEAALIGAAIPHVDPYAIAELALAETAPFDDHHATADYRRTVGHRVFARALGEALDARQAA